MREGVAFEALIGAEVEARTQELGRELYRRVQGRRPSTSERLQDRLMVILMQDPKLRTRLLRFIDAAAALPTDRTGRRTASLFREYFQTDFPGLPPAMRLALALAKSRLMPSPLFGWMAREAIRLNASRFIVKPEPNTVYKRLQWLESRSRNVSFDLLGEAVVSEAEGRQYRQAYLDLIDHLGHQTLAHERTIGGSPCLEVSLKLSSLTSQFNPADPEGTLRRVRPALEDIFGAAQERGIGVTVDAEQYAFRELIWYILRSVLGPGEAFGK